MIRIHSICHTPLAHLASSFSSSSHGGVKADFEIYAIGRAENGHHSATGLTASESCHDQLNKGGSPQNSFQAVTEEHLLSFDRSIIETSLFYNHHIFTNL